MQIKALSIFAISLSATAIFAVANVAFADSYESKDNISSISVAVKDNTLDPSDIRTRQVWDEQSESFITSAYYDIYDYDNLILTVNYLSGEKKSYTGTEITSVCGKAETPFIISDNQSEKAWTTGTHTVTCYFGGKSSDISFTVKESEIEAVTVTPQYDIKFIYGLDGENVTVSDENGVISEICKYPLNEQYYEINITYTDGSTERYTNTDIKNKNLHSIEFVQPNGILGIGTHTASCFVDGIKADFIFEITENSIQGISLFLPDGKDSLTFSKDGITDTDINGKLYPRFLYDIPSIIATVSYTNGTTENMPLGQLCRDLKDELIIDDEQKIAPWQTDKVTLKARIRNIPCTLTLNIATENISDLNVQATSSLKATFSWDRVYCAGYELLKIDGDDQQIVADVPFGTETVTISNLSPTTDYTFAVRSYTFNEKGERQYTKNVSTGFSIPFATVSGFKTASRTTDSVTVKWNKSAGADGYIINHYVDGKWVRLADISNADTTTYTINNLSAAESKKLYIKAYKSVGGKKVYSSATYHNTLTNPDIVSNLTQSSAKSDRITLQWDKNSKADGYIVKLYKDGEWVKVNSGADNSCTITGLSASSSYKLYIRAYKSHGSSTAYSKAVYITAYTSPANVSGFKTASRTTDSITVKWNKNTGADGYIINHYVNGEWVRLADISNADTTTYTINNLSAAESKKLYIKAYKSVDGKKIYSSATYHNTLTNPDIVSNLTQSSAKSDRITLQWDKNSKADGYIVKLKKDGEWVNVSSGADNSCTVTGLSASSSYKLYIKAYKSHGNSTAYSKAVYITAYTSPANVSGFKTASRTTDSITVKWNKSTGADGYIINHYVDGKWIRLADISNADTTTYTINNLSAAEDKKLYIKVYKTVNKKKMYSSAVYLNIPANS